MSGQMEKAGGSAAVEEATSSDEPTSSWCSDRCHTALLVTYAHLCLFFGIGISTSLTVFLNDIVQEFDSSITTLGIFFSVRALTFGMTSEYQCMTLFFFFFFLLLHFHHCNF